MKYCLEETFHNKHEYEFQVELPFLIFDLQLPLASSGRSDCPAQGPATVSEAVGARLLHSSFGEGHVTHLFGSGEKVSIAVKFEGMGPKILDPRLAPIQPL